MALSENTPVVRSHDFYAGPTDGQREMLTHLRQLEDEYGALVANHPLFRAAMHTWVEVGHEDNDQETFYALSQLKFELDKDAEGLTEEERATNPDAALRKMAELRLKIAALKLDIQSSEQVTSVTLQSLVLEAA